MTTKSNKMYKTKPLENLTVDIEEDGISRKVPALSSYFITPRSPIQFTAPPKKSKQGQFLLGAKEDWLCKMVIYKSNLEWLLSLPHHRFWSQVVYGNDTWDAVISFLQEGYPFYCLDNLTEDEDIQETYYIIMNLVFKIFARISTQKESKENWIGDKKYGSLLYNYTILSVPIFLDLCVIFGVFNAEEVKRIIVNSFEAQPLYKEDFNNSVQHIKSIFHSIEEQFSNSSSSGLVSKLSDRKLPIKDMTITHVQDIVFYSLDISVTLSTFVEYYQEAASILHSHRFEVNVASFYDNVITDLSRRIQIICDKEGNMDTYFTLMFKLNQARYFFIQLFHQCIQSTLNDRNDGGECISKDSADAYLDILADCLIYKTFMRDYQNKFPIKNDLEMLWKKCPELDNVKYNFLLESILVCLSPKKESKVEGSAKSNLINNQVLPITSSSSSASKIEVQGIELESLVTEVKDILPHLGDGFVKKCLQFYNYSSSSVINAILENNLPDCLSSISQSLPNVPSENHILAESSSKLNQDPAPFIPPENVNPYFPERVNVFDNDEFDIMTRDHMDTNRIFKGKRNDPKQRDLKDVIDDKSFRHQLRNKFSLLGLIEETDNTYDDEYDDTYDDSEFPVPEAGEQPFQKFVTPRVLEQAQKKTNAKSSGQNEESPEEIGGAEDDYEEEEEEETTLARGRNELLFVENPEQVRARFEDQRMKKLKPSQREQQQPTRNVVGNPKGQGQDKDIQFNRNKKNVHKSYQANHSRKKAALHKRFQGM